ncbi:MAG: hypothetical protein P4L84_23220 [Isosphaeraceae bacterium]|nr:hypothetical protein [Isosphaeraceae bacterium]
MTQFLLRVEAVNLVNVIDDTDDLSTRRGGGLMILNAATQMLETLRADIRTRLTPVATGASIGLFAFEAVDEKDAENVRAAVESHFQIGTLEYPVDQTAWGHLPLKHGTYVVDVEPMGLSPAEAEQKAVAKNRWRQMSAPSLSLDGLWPREAADACEFDFVRPATTVVEAADGAKNASESVRARRDYGRNARQKFYEHELETCDFAFVDGLQELSDPRRLDKQGAPFDENDAPPDARDKLAVFYVDGNRFGATGRGMWAGDDPVDTFREWSEAIRGHHRDLLRGLLGRAAADASWKNGSRLRLETLLWGGDEILWVAPAWKGWELARWFFGQTHEVTVRAQPRRLTYGAGLVFCHRNAPINNIITLAHRLGTIAKRAGDSVRHRLAYEVLESFNDRPGEDLDVHRRRLLPEGVPVEGLVLDPVRGEMFWGALRRIAASDDFPTRQLYLLVKAWRKREPFAAHKKRLDACGVGPALASFREETGEAAWLHLLQMLPYIPTGPSTADWERVP